MALLFEVNTVWALFASILSNSQERRFLNSIIEENLFTFGGLSNDKRIFDISEAIYGVFYKHSVDGIMTKLALSTIFEKKKYKMAVLNSYAKAVNGSIAPTGLSFPSGSMSLLGFLYILVNASFHDIKNQHSYPPDVFLFDHFIPSLGRVIHNIPRAFPTHSPELFNGPLSDTETLIVLKSVYDNFTSFLENQSPEHGLKESHPFTTEISIRLYGYLTDHSIVPELIAPILAYRFLNTFKCSNNVTLTLKEFVEFVVRLSLEVHLKSTDDKELTAVEKLNLIVTTLSNRADDALMLLSPISEAESEPSPQETVDQSGAPVVTDGIIEKPEVIKSPMTVRPILSSPIASIESEESAPVSYVSSAPSSSLSLLISPQKSSKKSLMSPAPTPQRFLMSLDEDLEVELPTGGFVRVKTLMLARALAKKYEVADTVPIEIVTEVDEEAVNSLPNSPISAPTLLSTMDSTVPLESLKEPSKQRPRRNRKSPNGSASKKGLSENSHSTDSEAPSPPQIQRTPHMESSASEKSATVLENIVENLVFSEESPSLPVSPTHSVATLPLSPTGTLSAVPSPATPHAHSISLNLPLHVPQPPLFSPSDESTNIAKDMNLSDVPISTLPESPHQWLQNATIPENPSENREIENSVEASNNSASVRELDEEDMLRQRELEEQMRILNMEREIVQAFHLHEQDKNNSSFRPVFQPSLLSPSKSNPIIKDLSSGESATKTNTSSGVKSTKQKNAIQNRGYCSTNAPYELPGKPLFNNGFVTANSNTIRVPRRDPPSIPNPASKPVNIPPEESSKERRKLEREIATSLSVSVTSTHSVQQKPRSSSVKSYSSASSAVSAAAEAESGNYVSMNDLSTLVNRTERDVVSPNMSKRSTNSHLQGTLTSAPPAPLPSTLESALFPISNSYTNTTQLGSSIKENTSFSEVGVFEVLMDNVGALLGLFLAYAVPFMDSLAHSDSPLTPRNLVTLENALLFIREAEMLPLLSQSLVKKMHALALSSSSPSLSSSKITNSTKNQQKLSLLQPYVLLSNDRSLLGHSRFDSLVNYGNTFTTKIHPSVPSSVRSVPTTPGLNNSRIDSDENKPVVCGLDFLQFLHFILLLAVQKPLSAHNEGETHGLNIIGLRLFGFLERIRGSANERILASFLRASQLDRAAIMSSIASIPDGIPKSSRSSSNHARSNEKTKDEEMDISESATTSMNTSSRVEPTSSRKKKSPIEPNSSTFNVSSIQDKNSSPRDDSLNRSANLRKSAVLHSATSRSSVSAQSPRANPHVDSELERITKLLELISTSSASDANLAHTLDNISSNNPLNPSSTSVDLNSAFDTAISKIHNSSSNIVLGDSLSNVTSKLQHMIHNPLGSRPHKGEAEYYARKLVASEILSPTKYISNPNSTSRVNLASSQSGLGISRNLSESLLRDTSSSLMKKHEVESLKKSPGKLQKPELVSRDVVISRLYPNDHHVASSKHKSTANPTRAAKSDNNTMPEAQKPRRFTPRESGLNLLQKVVGPSSINTNATPVYVSGEADGSGEGRGLGVRIPTELRLDLSNSPEGEVTKEAFRASSFLSLGELSQTSTSSEEQGVHGSSSRLGNSNGHIISNDKTLDVDDVVDEQYFEIMQTIQKRINASLAQADIINRLEAAGAENINYDDMDVNSEVFSESKLESGVSEKETFKDQNKDSGVNRESLEALLSIASKFDSSEPIEMD